MMWAHKHMTLFFFYATSHAWLSLHLFLPVLLLSLPSFPLLFKYLRLQYFHVGFT